MRYLYKNIESECLCMQKLGECLGISTGERLLAVESLSSRLQPDTLLTEVPYS